MPSAARKPWRWRTSAGSSGFSIWAAGVAGCAGFRPGTHEFGAPCASTVPVGDTCIDVTLTAPYTELGPLTVSRIAFLNVSLFNPSTPTCIPIETQGTVTLRDGTIGMRGVGSVCLADGTASYNLIVTGGTGRYEGVLGGGEITIPPPTSNSTGRELWSVDLYVKR